MSDWEFLEEFILTDILVLFYLRRCHLQSKLVAYKNIIQYIKKSKSYVSQIISKFEAKGLVYKRRAESSEFKKSRTFLGLTEEGLKFIEKIMSLAK
ncbi:MAG: hypothetical protein ACTSR8_11990 [Promethearchaeota archaeon]